MNIVFVESLGMCECTINKSLATLKKPGHIQSLFITTGNENEEVLIERARNAEVVVVSNIPLRKHFFENCPKLRMLSVAFTGVDHIDLEECKKRGITVCNAAGYSTEAVAELTIGMMIAVYRKMVGGDAILRIGGDRQGVLGSELHGKTVGIVGLGAIGQRVALLANAFGCKVLGYNRSPKALPHITQVDKDTLLRQSDIITVHLPLNPGNQSIYRDKRICTHATTCCPDQHRPGTHRQPGSALQCPEKRTNSRSSRRCLRSGTSASSEPGII